jgi:hypothetical protein
MVRRDRKGLQQGWERLDHHLNMIRTKNPKSRGPLWQLKLRKRNKEQGPLATAE